MKIAQFGRDVSDTGGGRVILETSRHMVLKGYDVLIVTDDHLPNAEDLGLSVKTMPIGQSLKKWAPRNKPLKILRQFLRMLLFMAYGTFESWRLAQKGWIVLNHNIEHLGGDILVLHNVFIHEFTHDPRGKRNYWRLINPVFVLRIVRERSSFFIFRKRFWVGVSAATEKQARPFLDKCTKLSHINNGVNTEDFFPLSTDERQKIRISHNEHENFILLFVGHEFEGKGLANIIEALILLPDTVRLKVIGGRLSNQSIYERLAEKIGVTNRVNFLGSIRDTRQYYQLADVFILPSAYETWALVGLESMACGTPALMTKVGGITEYLNHGCNGFFIERSAKDIAEKVKAMMENREMIALMRQCARATALHHSWQFAADEYIALAKAALNLRT